MAGINSINDKWLYRKKEALGSDCGKSILRRTSFLDRLKTEKRRTERSRSPFSIAVFVLRPTYLKRDDMPRDFLRSLLRSTRETDIKGWIDSGVIAVILPDTDKKGVKRCVKKIVEGNGFGRYSALTATYPDDLIETILCGEREIPDLHLLHLDKSHSSRRLQQAVKRTMDFTGALIGMLVFSPIMALTALAVKLTSPGPVIFIQKRVGRNGARFDFLKFRSMHANGSDAIHRRYVTKLIEGKVEEVNQGNPGKPFFKIRSDPRITPLGKVIRKTSIDELPQFYNVLKGEMSLVGPRPPLLYEVEKYEPWHLRRILDVKPGMTGLWQVDGRSRTSFDDMVRLDVRYAENWSVLLDLKILMKTIGAVFRSSGAL